MDVEDLDIDCFTPNVSLLRITHSHANECAAERARICNQPVWRIRLTEPTDRDRLLVTVDYIHDCHADANPYILFFGYYDLGPVQVLPHLSEKSRFHFETSLRILIPEVVVPVTIDPCLSSGLLTDFTYLLLLRCNLALLYLEAFPSRSEERRVGKECRSRWSPHH